MAKRVDAFPVVQKGTRYPWDEWLDGSVWELKRGEDFDADTKNMRTMLYNAASKRQMRVRVAIVDDTLTLQATPKED